MRVPTIEIPRAGSRVLLVPLESRHLDAVARLHQQALPTAHLTRLGPAFLRHLYRGIARAPGSMVCVAESPAGETVGYISGTNDVARCFRSTLLRELPGLTATAIRAAALSPRVWRAMCETLAYPLRQSRTESERSVPGSVSAELLSMAVTEDARGMGIGRALVHALDEFLASQSGVIDRYRVVTDALDERSNAFYRSTGFTFVQQITHHRHPMNLYYRLVARN